MSRPLRFLVCCETRRAVVRSSRAFLWLAACVAQSFAAAAAEAGDSSAPVAPAFGAVGSILPWAAAGVVAVLLGAIVRSRRKMSWKALRFWQDRKLEQM
jgi:hypothetical protein